MICWVVISGHMLKYLPTGKGQGNCPVLGRALCLQKWDLSLVGTLQGCDYFSHECTQGFQELLYP